jgi:hypothetical protein
VSYNHFGHNYYAHQHAEHWDNGHPAPHFAVAAAAPAYRAVAGANVTPIRWAGSRNLPPGGGSYAAGNSRADVAVPRSSTAPGARSGALQPVGTLPATGPPAGPAAGQTAASRDIAVPRGSTAPRYVNRGDDIVRSATERPTPPAPANYSGPRTAPEGAVRRADAAPPAYDRQTNAYGAARPDAPGYSRAPVPGSQPRATDPRVAEPRAGALANRPGTAGAAEVNPAYRPRYDPPGRPTEYARPRGGEGDPRPTPAPSATARPAPAPQPQPSAPAGGGERAAPRQGPPPAGGGSASSRRGGRGGI